MTAERVSRTIARTAPIVCLLAAAALTGCAGGGSLALRSAQDETIALDGRFDTGVYAYHDENTIDIVLSEGDPATAGQLVHIRMYWQPWAGRTPIDQRSTNSTIRYLVFASDAAGVYEGGGYLFPRINPGGAVFVGDLRSTALRLADATESFVDRLGLAEATGQFSARRDEVQVHNLLQRAETRLRERLGYPRFVDAVSDDPAALAAN